MNARCVKENVVPQTILKQVLERNNEETIRKYAKHLLHRWSFWFGPDLIRGPDGAFYVCEDNIGYVGGMGDLQRARESLLNFFPEYKPVINHTHLPEQFY